MSKGLFSCNKLFNFCHWNTTEIITEKILGCETRLHTLKIGGRETENYKTGGFDFSLWSLNIPLTFRHIQNMHTELCHISTCIYLFYSLKILCASQCQHVSHLYVYSRCATWNLDIYSWFVLANADVKLQWYKRRRKEVTEQVKDSCRSVTARQSGIYFSVTFVCELTELSVQVSWP